MKKRNYGVSSQELQNNIGNLSLEDACTYYKNGMHSFQLDLPTSLSCANRFLGENKRNLSNEARILLEESIKAAVHLANLDPNVLRMGMESGLVPGADMVIKVLEATHVEPDVYNQARQASVKFHAKEIRSICQNILLRNPMAIRFADLLLWIDQYEGKDPDEALNKFQCPKILRSLWVKRLFDHYNALGKDETAWPLWEQIQHSVNDHFSFIRAAEMYRRASDQDKAISLYEQAVKAAPLQHPYALRLNFLRSPFVPDKSLVEQKKVCIYLYSWNKAEILGDTLKSLSACHIGSARIKVLLNGCTDNSAQVVEEAKKLFSHNEFEIIELPVNIGAPAARNWLLSQPATRESDYVAFLDDDVFLQPDWLDHMLTVAESDPTIGNVGCKVVFPGEHHMLQYLYRYVALCSNDNVIISLPTPLIQYDTGLYDVIRETRVVMGCQHLLRVASLDDAPLFDIRYSPSQIDDTDHDLQLGIAGWKVMYCGTVKCVHRQNSGTSMRSQLNLAAQGSIMGNDVKFSYKWLEKADQLRKLDSLSCGDFRR